MSEEMFEKAITELRRVIDEELKPAINKCYELKGRVTDPGVKARLETKYDELDTLITRASLCVTILEGKVSITHREDYMEVKLV